MAQVSATKKVRERQLVFEKAKYDPLANPDVFGPTHAPKSLSPVNVDPDKKTTSNSEHKEDDDEETKYDKIEANIERAKMLKKKKVDFRAEMTSDSNEIDDLLLFRGRKDKNDKEQIKEIDEELLSVGDDDLLRVEKKKSDKKSLEELLAETDNMFKEIEEKEDGVTAKDLDIDLNVDDNFNFDQYINQQDGANDD